MRTKTKDYKDDLGRVQYGFQFVRSAQRRADSTVAATAETAVTVEGMDDRG